MTKMDKLAIEQFFAEQFPQAIDLGTHIDAVGGGTAMIHLEVDDRHLRPGGTVSGPTLMTLADTATFIAILAELGPVGLAVTTSLDIHFLRKPTLGRVVARAQLVKVGRRLAVASVTLTSASVAEGPVAIATVTYSLPSR